MIELLASVYDASAERLSDGFCRFGVALKLFEVLGLSIDSVISI